MRAMCPSRVTYQATKIQFICNGHGRNVNILCGPGVHCFPYLAKLIKTSIYLKENSLLWLSLTKVLLLNSNCFSL